MPPPPAPYEPTQTASGAFYPPVAPTQMASGASYPPVAPTQMAPGAQSPFAPTQLAADMSGGTLQAPPPPSNPGMGQSGPGWMPATPPPLMVPPPMQPRQRSGLSTATIVILIILLVVVCGAAILGVGVWHAQTQNANATMTAIVDNANATATGADTNATASANATSEAATTTAQLTPTPYPPYNESNPPSGVNFSGLAQQIVPTAQMASQLNSQYQPTELQSVFTPGQTMYIAYHWINVGYSGYVYTIWYFNGQQATTYRSAYISTIYSYYNGYVSYSIYRDGQGAVEVYWCSRSDCSDRLLAWVRPFTVSG